MTMVPTDKQINLLAAEACGYFWTHHRDGQPENAILNPPGTEESPYQIRCAPPSAPDYWQYDDAPNYCTNANALADLLRAVEAQGEAALRAFSCQMTACAVVEARKQYGERGADLWPYTLCTLETRLMVEVALRVLGHWPRDWKLFVEALG